MIVTWIFRNQKNNNKNLVLLESILRQSKHTIDTLYSTLSNYNFVNLTSLY